MWRQASPCACIHFATFLTSESENDERFRQMHVPTEGETIGEFEPPERSPPIVPIAPHPLQRGLRAIVSPDQAPRFPFRNGFNAFPSPPFAKMDIYVHDGAKACKA